MKLFKLLLLFNILLIGCASSSEINNKENKEYVATASYYGDHFHGRRTANGEIFNKFNLTAAHKKLSFGTKVKVTNIKSRLSVIVRINDRGPFIKGRDIDLSEQAAKLISCDGICKVKIKRL